MPQIRQALIMDDDEEVVVELRSLLRGLGFRVTTISDPALLEDTLGDRRYELALVNLALPDKSWPGTFQTIKSASRTTTVVMMTRHADEKDVRLAYTAGAFMMLDRPVTSEQLAGLTSPQADGLFVVLRG